MSTAKGSWGLVSFQSRSWSFGDRSVSSPSMQWYGMVVKGLVLRATMLGCKSRCHYLPAV